MTDDDDTRYLTSIYLIVDKGYMAQAISFINKHYNPPYTVDRCKRNSIGQNVVVIIRDVKLKDTQDNTNEIADNFNNNKVYIR